jgi:hypothetical protein
VPKLPPVAVNVVEEGEQIVVVPEMPVGADDAVFTVMLALEGEVSEFGTLSTCAFIVAVTPPVPFEVNVLVAVPVA